MGGEKASEKFIIGPASATSAMPRRGMRKPARVHRHRLGPAEHEQHPADGQQLADASRMPGSSMRAEAVDMAQGIQREPAGFRVRPSRRRAPSAA